MKPTSLSKSPSLFSKFLTGTILAAGLAASAQAITIYIDFGADATITTASGWNNVTSTLGAAPNTTPLPNMVSSTGSTTGISLSIVNRFNGANTMGTSGGLGSYPGTATNDSLYGNTESFGSGANMFPSFRLGGLVVGQTYDFKFFASRTGVTGSPPDNRETQYTLAGATSGSVTLNATNNTTNTVTYSLTPNASGEILISIGPGANNNNSNHFTYLNVLEINTVPEPGSVALLGLGGLLLMRRRR